MAADFRLRFWAFCQGVYEIIRVPLQQETWSATRDVFARVVFEGHLHNHCFIGLLGDFVSLNDPTALADDEWVIRVVHTQFLRHLEQYDRKRSGYLRGYLRAQRAHLDACEECQQHVCLQVRLGVHISRAIKELFDDSPQPPSSK